MTLPRALPRRLTLMRSADTKCGDDDIVDGDGDGDGDGDSNGVVVVVVVVIIIIIITVSHCAHKQSLE